MTTTNAYGNFGPSEPLKKIEINRREPKADDVVIEIKYCGICHSDIHTARSEWGPTKYPCVPGHEIVGNVIQTGSAVKKFNVGDSVGVGCYVDSCGQCENCKNGSEQYCQVRTIFTYNSLDVDGQTATLGGYSKLIVVKEKYVLKVQPHLPLERVAPLLCAGITTYSPLKRYNVQPGQVVGVVGLGGLGHMAVKFAKAMGAEVVVFSTSAQKENDAKKLGASHFVVTTNADNFISQYNKLNLIINTVSANLNLSPYLACLKMDGTMVLVGAPPKPNEVSAFALIGGRKKITGSLIGGITETQEMLDFCADKKVFSDIELISAQQINDAYEKTIKGQVKYRFVIDVNTI